MAWLKVFEGAEGVEWGWGVEGYIELRARSRTQITELSEVSQEFRS